MCMLNKALINRKPLFPILHFQLIQSLCLHRDAYAMANECELDIFQFSFPFQTNDDSAKHDTPIEHR